MRILAGTILAASVSLAMPAFAGEQYVDPTGYAVSGHDVVAYFDLAPGEAAIPGRAEFAVEWNGAKFAFDSAANRDRFLADPAAFAPQYDGHCAFGVAKGGKVPGNPDLWRIVDGKLYLNITRNVVGFWEADIPGNLAMSEANWTGLEPLAASSDPIPQFDPDAPIAN